MRKNFRRKTFNWLVGVFFFFLILPKSRRLRVAELEGWRLALYKNDAVQRLRSQQVASLKTVISHVFWYISETCLFNSNQQGFLDTNQELLISQLFLSHNLSFFRRSWQEMFLLNVFFGKIENFFDFPKEPKSFKELLKRVMKYVKGTNFILS